MILRLLIPLLIALPLLSAGPKQAEDIPLNDPIGEDTTSPPPANRQIPVSEALDRTQNSWNFDEPTLCYYIDRQRANLVDGNQRLSLFVANYCPDGRYVTFYVRVRTNRHRMMTYQFSEFLRARQQETYRFEINGLFAENELAVDYRIIPVMITEEEYYERLADDIRRRHEYDDQFGTPQPRDDIRIVDSPNPEPEAQPIRTGMDPREVTVREFRRHEAVIRQLERRADWLSYHDGVETCNYEATGRDDHPMNCVNWYAAQIYCEIEMKRLPTEQEWEHVAGMGPQRRLASTHSAASPNTHCVGGHAGDTGTCTVGQYPQNAWGVGDMVGNVWEWTLTPEGESPTTMDQISTRNRWAKGGSWVDTDPERWTIGSRMAVNPRSGRADVGFRCFREQGNT